MPDIDPLAEQLHAARILQGLTQRDLSARSGISQTTIAGVERGRYGMNLHTLRHLANALGLDVVLVEREG